MNKPKKIWTNFLNGGNNWTKLAGAVFALTAIVTIWMLWTIASLNMLPILYLLIVILLIVLLLLAAFYALFSAELSTKKKSKGKKVNKKKVFTLRCVGLVLALCLVIVDAVGINMISQLQGAITDIIEEDGVAYESVGLYVKIDDNAEKLKDVSGYDLGLSYAYDSESAKTAVEKMDKVFGKKFEWKEYDTDVAAVDALLAGEQDAILLHTGYYAVVEAMEGYEDLSLRVKMIHEFKMEDLDAEEIQLSDRPDNITEDPFIVYVSGNDTKSSMKNVRSDVNILAVVNPKTKQVLLINTPRDYYVELCGSGKGDGKMDKLTHAGIYGIECSMLTLSNLYDHPIPYYAQVSFNGFKSMIDALGGITVYSDAEFFAAESGTQIYKGENKLNGEEALGFVRERHNLPDGDAARGRHQMAVIQAIIKKVASGTILTRYSAILDSMGSCFKTNVNNDEISDLVKMQLGDMASWDIKSYSVIGDGSGARDYCYSIPSQTVYVLPQHSGSVEHAKMLMDKVFDGETITEEDLVLPQ